MEEKGLLLVELVNGVNLTYFNLTHSSNGPSKSDPFLFERAFSQPITVLQAKMGQNRSKSYKNVKKNNFTNFIMLQIKINNI